MNSRTRAVAAVLAMLPVGLSGQTLTRQDAATEAQLIAVSAVNDRVIWASGSRGTWVRSTDGGVTWTVGRVAGADSLAFRDVHAVSADTAWLLSIGNGDQSRIYRTSDGGRSWALQYTATDPRMFLDCLAFWDSRRGLAVSDGVAGEFVVLATEDGGAHWNRLPPDRFPQAKEGEGFFASSGTCVATIGTRHAWLGTGAGKIARVLRSTDGGRSWRESPTPLVQNTATAGITTVAFRDTLHGVVAGGDVARNADASANVAVTVDGGATWSLTAGLPGTVYAAAFVPGSGRLVVTGPTGAHLSDDGGRTFRRLTDENHWGLGFSPQGVGWMVGPKGRITRIVIDGGR